MKYRKTALVEAEVATEDGTISTPEGLMAYKAGDYIITNSTGEKYPCIKAIFEETYEAVDE